MAQPTNSEERKRAWDVLTQWAGWAGPACLVWLGMMQRQVDRLEERTSVEIRTMRETNTNRDTGQLEVLAQVRSDLASLRAQQSIGFDDVKQRLARLEAKGEAR